MPRKIEQEYWIKDKASGEMRKASQKVQDQLNAIENTSNRVTTGMSTAFKALATVIGAGALIASFKTLISQTLTYGDELNKLNLRLGVSVENLDKMKQAGEFAGVQFNTITRSISIMARNLEMASTGTGEQAEALNKLGISLKDLEGLDPEEQFLKLGEAISSVSDPMERQALAMQLLGRGGVEMLSMLPTLRQQMSELNSQWNNEKAQKVADFNDKVTMLRQKFVDLGVTLTIAIIPALTMLVDNFGAVLTVVGLLVAVPMAKWLYSLAAGLATATTASIAFLAAQVKNVKLMGDMMKVMGAGMGAQAFADFTAQMGGATIAGSGFASILAAINPVVVGVIAVITTLAGLMYLQYRKTKQAKEALDEYKESLKGLGELTIAAQIGVINQKIKEQKKIVEDFQKKVKETQGGPSGRGYMGLGSAAQDAAAAQREIERLTQKLELLESAYKKISEASVDATSGLSKDSQRRYQQAREIYNLIRSQREQEAKDAADAAKKIADDKATLEKQLATLKFNLSQESLRNAGKNEQAEIEAKKKLYEDLIKLAHNDAELRKQIEEQLQQAIRLIQDRYAKERAESEYKIRMEALDKSIADGMEREKRARDEASKAIMSIFDIPPQLNWFDTVIKSMEDAGLAAEDAANIISTHSTDAIMSLLEAGNSLSESWENIKDGFADFAAAILRDMARILIQAAIFNAAMASLKAVGGWGSTAASFISSMFASGGHTKGGEPIVVGEAGPEIFMPDSGGTVMSNMQSKRMMRGEEGGTNQVFNININRPVGSDDDAKRIGKIIAQELNIAIDRRIMFQAKPGGILRPQPSVGRM